MATISARTFCVVGPIGDVVILQDRSRKSADRIWSLHLSQLAWEPPFSVALERPDASGNFLPIDAALPRVIGHALLAAAIRDGAIPVTRDTGQTQ